MGIFLDWITGNDAPSILKATRFTPSFPVTYNNIHSGEINQRMNQIYNTRGNDFINSVEMAGYLYMRNKGASYEEAGCFAAAMSTIKLEKSGPFSGTEEEVWHILKNNKQKPEVLVAQ